MDRPRRDPTANQAIGNVIEALEGKRGTQDALMYALRARAQKIQEGSA